MTMAVTYAPGWGRAFLGNVKGIRVNETDGVLDNLHSTVFTLDRALAFQYVNPAGEMLFGISRRRLVGRALAEILPGNDAWIAQLERTLQSGHPYTVHDLDLVVPGGHHVSADCTVTPLTGVGMAPRLLIELIQIDRLLRLARDETRSGQYQASRELLRALAHEVKNPLGGLRGAAQLLEQELPSNTLKEYTRIIIHEADRLRNLVDRMVGPNALLRKQPTNIHQVMDHVRRLIRAEVTRGIRIEHDFDPSIPEFGADAEQLIQAVLNVARNAVQALNGEGTVRFRTRVERQFTIGQKRHRLAVRAEIEDNGPGIPDELRESIFYPMVTGKPDGTGLGLSIAQDIVHQHGGMIEFASRPEQTIFRIYLPMENEHG